MKHIVNFSFGEGSFVAAKKLAAEVGHENMLLVFADTKWEDEETYKWGAEAAANVGAKLVRVADGRTPPEVFIDERYLGNSRVDPCSKKLKRELIDAWLTENYDPAEVTCHFGIHASESDRFRRWDKKEEAWKGIQPRMEAAGWKARAPLCEPPLDGWTDIVAVVMREIGWRQRLYKDGFPHGNCGGRCVKQGQAGFKLLLAKYPERYAEMEKLEADMQALLGKQVTILREQERGERVPLPLSVLRGREDYPLYDFGGCACFAGSEDYE